MSKSSPIAVYILIFTSLIVFPILFFINFHNEPLVIERDKMMMGTIISVKIPANSRAERAAAESAIEKAFKEISRIEGVFSVFDPASEVSRINRLRAGEELVLSEEVFDLTEKALEYSKATSGAFDITVKPLVDLWKGAKKNNMPGEADVSRVLMSVGYDKVVLNRGKRTISFTVDGMGLDFGGIAKGYASVMAMKILKDNGTRDAIVNPGGEMFCMGRKSVKEMWRVGIKHPRGGGILFEIRLKDKAIATSGDYERFFVVDGRRYSHIIDPRNGYPVGDNVVSATVITDDPVLTDAFATALVISGDVGLKAFGSAAGIDSLLIIRDGKKLRAVTTEGFGEKYYVIAKDKL